MRPSLLRFSRLPWSNPATTSTSTTSAASSTSRYSSTTPRSASSATFASQHTGYEKHGKAEFTVNKVEKRETEKSRTNINSFNPNSLKPFATENIGKEKLTTEDNMQSYERSPEPSQETSTAASTFASTSKHASSSRPSTLPPFPLVTPIQSSRPYRSPAQQLVQETPLPDSETSFYLLLRRIKSVYPSTSALWFFEFHNDSSWTKLTSSRTFSWILELAFRDSNRRLVEVVLEEMERRGIVWDKAVGKVLAKGYQRFGEQEKARQVLERIEEERRVNRFGSSGRRKLDKDYSEWIVEGRNAKRMDITGKGKGKAKEGDVLLGGEGIGWKGWSARVRELDAFEAEEKAREDMENPVRDQVPKIPVRGRTKKRPPASTLPFRRAAVRRRILIPPNSTNISPSSLANLCQLLTQDRRSAEAFALADSWLYANRLNLPFPSPSRPGVHWKHVQLAENYNSTALVLLNILLKPLLLSRLEIPQIFDFISTFLARHAPLPFLPQHEPPLSTLRQLLSAVTGKTNAWKTGKRIVDHFGYKWGFPVGDEGFEKVKRIRFQQPTDEGRRAFLHLGDLNSSLSPSTPLASTQPIVSPRAPFSPVQEDTEPPHLLSDRPHTVVPPSVAILLLRHAVDTHSKPSTRFLAFEILEFRRWWNGFDRAGCEYLGEGSRKARGLVNEAKEIGLLPKNGKKTSRVAKDAKDRDGKEGGNGKKSIAI